MACQPENLFRLLAKKIPRRVLQVCMRDFFFRQYEWNSDPRRVAMLTMKTFA